MIGQNLKRWDGTEKSGRYTYPQDLISEWGMTQDEDGTVFYMTRDAIPQRNVWCPAFKLTAHLCMLEKINAR